MLWQCVSWAQARDPWLPWIRSTAVGVPGLGPPEAWPACLQRTGLLPAWASEGADRAAVRAFIHRLYGMYLVVLACRMERGAQGPARHERRLPRGPRIGGRGGGYPWGQLHGPLPRPPPRQPLLAALGLPPGWRWDAHFKKDLLEWASRLQWQAQPASVSFAELALDFEATANRALPAPPGMHLRGTTLSLQTRASVLRKALGWLLRHMLTGDLLQGRQTGTCQSLIPLGGHYCPGLTARPFFTALGAMRLLLRRLEMHCVSAWHAQMRTPAAVRRPVGQFLARYFPALHQGYHPLRPYQRPERRQVAAARGPAPAPAPAPRPRTRHHGGDWARGEAQRGPSVGAMGRRPLASAEQCASGCPSAAAGGTRGTRAHPASPWWCSGPQGSAR